MPKKGYRQTLEHKEKHLSKIRGERNYGWKGGIKSRDPLAYYRIKTREWAERNPEKKKYNRQKNNLIRRKAGGKLTFDDWMEIRNKYGDKCLCCGIVAVKSELTIDHIIPLWLGGMNVKENIQPLCRPCNNRKRLKIVDYRVGQETHL